MAPQAGNDETGDAGHEAPRVRELPVQVSPRSRNPAVIRPTDLTRNVDFEGRAKRIVSLFQIRRQHIFDPFHECADSARQIAPMCYDEGHGERPAMKIGYDLHKRSTF